MVNANDFSGRIIRAVRKAKGISQLELAKIMGIPQPTMSKIERGQSEINALQWAIFCEKFEIDHSSLLSGYVELDKSPITVSDEFEVGDFKLLKRYAEQRSTSVRFIAPILKYAEEVLGVDYNISFFKTKKIDPDYFYILDNTVNMRLVYEYLNELQKHVSLDKLLDGYKTSSNPVLHGRLKKIYDFSNGPTDNVVYLVKEMKYYDLSYAYEANMKSNALEVDMHLIKNDYQKKLKGYESENKILNDYRIKYLTDFQSYKGYIPHSTQKVQWEKDSCKLKLNF
jgi:transcriptional regulator with XRE-family HTH domain